MNKERKEKRRTWTNSETKALLNCYLSRKDEFLNYRKKKFAYQNLVEDLIALNVLQSPVTPVLLENKMKSLVRSYKSAVDNNNKTGSSPCIEPFAEEMEAIFGTGICAPENTNHVVHAGTSFSSTGSPVELSASSSQSNETTITMDEGIIESDSSQGPLSSNPSSSKEIKRKNRKTLKERMFEKKIELLQEKERNKVKRWEEKKELVEKYARERKEEKKQRHEDKSKLIAELILTLKK